MALTVPVEIPFAGGCACTAVRYECLQLPLRMLNCHCRDCQVAGGSACSPSLIMPRSAVRLTRGQPARFEKLADSGNVATREFCSSCGAPLFASSSAAVDYVAVRAASLDDPSWFRVEANVWMDSAQPWDYVDPAVPRFARNRPRIQQREGDA
jgi:hypothetical protein